jgi:staphylococcal nuclease domain-containing protein 1
MQRDVEVEFESTDKTGGYVGSLYANKTTNVGVELVRAGLASVHGFSAEQLSTGKALMAAEEEAKKARRGLWSSYDPAVEEAEKAVAAASLQPATALPTSYQDVIVSHVRTTPPFAFYVQTLNAANNQGQALEKLMSEFALHHKTTAAKAPVGWTPKPGEVVSAQFSEDGQWYRARTKRVSGMRKESEVLYID